MHEISISGGLEVAEASQAHAALCDRLAGMPEGSEISIEISERAPTQIALQLLFAALKSSDSRGISVTPGPNAGAIIQTTTEMPGA